MRVRLTAAPAWARHYAVVVRAAKDESTMPVSYIAGSGSTEGKGLLPWSCVNDGSGRRAPPLLFLSSALDEVERFERIPPVLPRRRQRPDRLHRERKLVERPRGGA